MIGDLTNGGGKELRGEAGTKMLLASYTAYRPSVVPVVVVGRVYATGIEVEVASVVVIVDRTRPIVAV